MALKTLSRTGVPGYHNPDIARRSDGSYAVWSHKTYADDDYVSAMAWILIAVKPSFKAALEFSRGIRKAS